MLEKDQFEQFLSDAFENQTETVRPDLWSGVQSKMASAGVNSTVAAKSVSLLTKWILGSIAVGSAATISTLVLFNNNEKPKSELVAPISSENNSGESDLTIQENSSSENLKTASKNNSGTETNYTLAIVEPTLIHCGIQSIMTSVEEIKENSELIAESTIKENTVTKTEESSTLHNTEEVSSVNDVVNNENSDIPVNKEDDFTDISSKVTKFPDIFTPNGDGVNDYYSIEVQNISNFHVSIMNVKNEIVYQSSDPNFKWDGSVNNEIQKSGQFACIVTGTDNNGKSFKDIQLFVIR